MFGAAALALALAAAPTIPAATELTPTPAMSAANIDFAKQFDLTSKITGRTYRIYVTAPFTSAPKGGFPVLYVLDGNTGFAIANGQAVLGLLGGAKPLVVVGVGYPDATAVLKLRNRDLTSSLPGPHDPSDWSDNPKPQDYGGADAFHRFMIEELRPVIAHLFAVNASEQSLMGYSLGGLFTLHVLFTHPGDYRNFIAGSPSIWFNDRAVLREEDGFAKAVRAGAAAPRILITSDQWEQSEQAPNLPLDAEKRKKALADMAATRMVENAAALASRLGGLSGRPGYEVRYALFPEETHLTGIPAATSRGVSFVEGR